MAYDDYLKAQKLALKAYKNKTVADRCISVSSGIG